MLRDFDVLEIWSLNVTQKEPFLSELPYYHFNMNETPTFDFMVWTTVPGFKVNGTRVNGKSIYVRDNLVFVLTLGGDGVDDWRKRQMVLGTHGCLDGIKCGSQIQTTNFRPSEPINNSGRYTVRVPIHEIYISVDERPWTLNVCSKFGKSLWGEEGILY